MEVFLFMETAEYLTCERRQIHVICEKGRATTQITLDDDHNLAEYKPDILKIVEKSGQVRLEEIKIEPDVVRLRGVLHFEVLYRCAAEDGGFAHMSGDLPFQEHVRVEGAQEYDSVYADPQIEDLSVTLINSRKLGIRSLITIHLELREPCVHDLAESLIQPREEQMQNLQMRTKEAEAMELLVQKKDTSRFRTSLSLPSNKPGIQEILWYSLQPRGIESRAEEGILVLSGEIFVHMVYRSAEEADQLQCLELAVPMQTQIEVLEADPQVTAWVRVRLAGGELETDESFDGEERQLRLEALLEIDYTLWQERTFTLLEDIYATDQQLNCIQTPVILQRLIIKNDSRFRLNERMELETTGAVLQICSCTGDVQVEEVTPAVGRLDVSGLLRLRLLYIAADDEMPLVTVEKMLPFQEAVEVPGLDPETMDISYELEAGIDQLTSTLLDQSQVECKAQIRLCVIVFENQTIRNMESIEAVPLDREQMRNLPGMVGYIVRNGENMWDIAKRYRVTIPQLQAWNGMGTEQVRPGDKLMIVNTIG